MSARKETFVIAHKVHIHATAGVYSVCRLCNQRNARGELLWALIIEPGHHLDLYCQDCYAYLYSRAVGDIPELIDPGVLTQPNPPTEVQKTIDVPAYLIKDNKALLFFWPQDKIDLGVIRQRARKRREQARKEKQDE